MISENKLHHMLGVARKAYQLAKDLGYSEKFARDMFVLGWNHDIAYEFDDVHHQSLGAEMMAHFGIENEYTYEIGRHGIPQQDEDIGIIYLILNCADLTVSPEGKPVTIDERIEDIKNKIGEDHEWFIALRDTGLLVKRKFKELYNMDV